MSSIEVHNPVLPTPRRRPSDDSVRKFLHREILRTPVGEALPSIRAIMNSCNVGQARVQEVLGELEDEGYVECRPRRGVFRSERSTLAESVPTLDFVACARIGGVDQPGTFTHELLAALNLEATERGHAMRVHQVHRGEPITAYDRIAARPDIRACLLFAPHSPEVIAAFQAHHLATLSLMPPSDETCLGHSIGEPVELVSRLLEHLEQHGHERIGYLERVYPNAPVQLSLHRRADYYRHMAERGLRVMPHWVADAGGNDEAALNAMAQLFSAKPEPTAVVLPSAAMPAAYRFLERTGRRVGHDVALAGIDENAACRSLHPEPTRAGIVQEATARLALDTLTAMLEGRGVPEQQPAPMRLTLGRSTCPSAEVTTDASETTDATGTPDRAASTVHVPGFSSPSSEESRL